MDPFSFRLKNIDDSIIGTDSFPDALGFLVIFMCNHCPYVIGSEDRIISLHHRYAPQGYPVIGINSNDPIQYPDDSFENMKIKASQKGFPFKYLFDETQEVARRYGAERTPQVFVLQKGDQSELKLIYSGAIDDNPKFSSEVKQKFLEPLMEALLENRVLPFSSQPALGCTVKWKKIS